VKGTPKQFLVSIGSWASAVSRETTAEQNINVRQAGRAYIQDGTRENLGIARADLTVGPMKVPDHEMFVMLRNGAIDGVLGADLMQNYDIELDFAGRKMNYFLTDHCPGRVVYWPAAGFTTVEFRGFDNNAVHALSIPVTIDGKQVIAEISTGHTDSVMDWDSARSLFSLTPDSPGAVPLGSLDTNPDHRMFGWTFKELKIGGLTITNHRVRVIPGLWGRKDADMLRVDSHVRRYSDEWQPTLRIGMDVLRRLHLYLATKERKIYITPAAAPAPAAGRGAATAN
jgi:hypothetical protein